MRYDAAWYQSLAQYQEWNERALWAVFAHLGRPGKLVDFGCGDATMVHVARRAGVCALGVEVSPDVMHAVPARFEAVHIHDLRLPLDLGERFDVVLCIEVGEHLESAYAPVLVETLVHHTEQWLVFTAGAPDQGGDGHINNQPQEYWRDLIEAGGLTYQEDVTDHLRDAWKWVTGPMFWLPQNLQIFERT